MYKDQQFSDSVLPFEHASHACHGDAHAHASTYPRRMNAKMLQVPMQYKKGPPMQARLLELSQKQTNCATFFVQPTTLHTNDAPLQCMDIVSIEKTLTTMHR